MEETAAHTPPTAVVSGGSLSGLMVAIVLKDLGYRYVFRACHSSLRPSIGAQAINVSVTVLERSLTVESQGAGIVLGRWSTAFFQVFDKTETEIAVPAYRRQFFNRNGSIMREEKINLNMTSWDKVCKLIWGSGFLLLTISSLALLHPSRQF
jgi:2,6-dihydroxypyridine 3-monooxygenase